MIPDSRILEIPGKILRFLKPSTGFRIVSDPSEWTQCLDDRKPIDVLYLDYQKAFDKVPHLRLISKLWYIHENLLTWIHNFLNNRRQHVCVRGSFSDWSQAISGVPQGT